ncbi:MAG: hypothetical protein WCL04_08700 [Verrucomicrobiota bacterium]
MGGSFSTYSAAPDETLFSLVTTSHGAQLVNSGDSLWLQILDQGDFTWRTLWFDAGVFVTGAAVPQGLIAVRAKGGFLQLRDNTSACWRSIWWSAGVLKIGVADTSADDPPGTVITTPVYRFHAGDNGRLLQLLDQADGTKFRTLILTHGAPGAGPLES